MDDSDGYERDELDDIIDATDTDTTTSTTTASSITSSMFDTNAFVLELHDLQKDDPALERQPESKVKRVKKKLKGPAVIKRTESSDSSGTEDVSRSVSFIDDPTKEQFYDAQESFHGLPGHPITGNTRERLLSQVDSDQLQEPIIVMEPSVERRTRSPTTAITCTTRPPSVACTSKLTPPPGTTVGQNMTTPLKSRTSRLQWCILSSGGIVVVGGGYLVAVPGGGVSLLVHATEGGRVVHFKKLGMEKTSRYKAKNKKSTGKPKTTKKRKSEGPTCSMFLAELTRKLASKKKRQEESSKNIVHTIIESITNALPIKFFKKRTEIKEPPVELENLQQYAPELSSSEIIEVPIVEIKTADDNESDIKKFDLKENARKSSFKVPKMPVVNSEVLKIAVEKSKKTVKEDAAVNTGGSNDVAIELAKHVTTLKKISLIAEEFNKKTAKNLKEIVDSVQEELMKKLEDIQAEQTLNNSKNIEPTQRL